MKQFLSKKRKKGIFKQVQLTALLAFSLLYSQSLVAQVLDQRVTLPLGTTTGLTVVTTIKEQVPHVQFTFDEAVNTKLAKELKITSAQPTVKEILDLLKTTFTINYKNTDNYIILSVLETQKNAIQDRGAIKGQIVESRTSQPLEGASVFIVELKKGVKSDDDGYYNLVDIPEGKYTLQVSYISYETARVEIEIKGGQQTSYNVNMQSSHSLDEVVVTAMNIKRSKQNLGYSVQEVKGEEIQQGGNPQLLNALSGKVAGVNISQNPGIGGSTRILIRGESSINGSNQPLFVVDGIPINNEITASSGANVDFGNGVMDISPNNIESISVLKGPNASALYGSRASNGVVLITTKKGSKNKPFTIDLSSSLGFQSVLKLPEYQNNWGGGKGPDYHFVNGNGTEGGIDGQGVNFGPRLDQLDPTTESGYVEIVQFGSPIDPVTGERIPIPWRSRPNNVRDFFEVGHTFDNSIAASGGGENSVYRLSYSQTDQKGTVPNTDYKRKNLNSSLSFDLGKYVTISSNLNYINSGSDNLPADGYSSSVMYNFLWFYRNVDLDWVKDYWLPGQEGYQQRNFETLWVNNVYFIVNENTNSFRKDRGVGNIMADVKILPNLKFSLRSNMDLFNDVRETRIAIGDRYVPRGRYTKQDIAFKEINNDFLLTYDDKVGENFKAAVSVGGNQRKTTRHYSTGQAPGLNIPFLYNFGNSSGEILNTQSDSEKHVNSLYSFANLSFYDALHIDLTARNDWSSALTKSDGSGNNSYFYPSVSMSLVLNNILKLPSFINHLKLRGSWAQVGNDTDPYQLRAAFQNDVSWGGVPSVNESGTIFNEDLKPEIVTSKEFGVELQAFNSRLNLDFTVYKSNSKNQILDLPVVGSSGYNRKIINAGEVMSQGIELSANGELIRRENLSWNLGLNWMTNQSKVIELTSGLSNYVMYSYAGNTIEAREGGYMGDMYGQVFEKSPEGQVIYYNGLPKLAAEKVKIGNYNPDWRAGITSNLRYKNWTFGLLFDYQKGGMIYSVTHSKGIHAGSLVNSAETGTIREDGIIGDGVIANPDGTFRPNDVVAPTFDFVRQSVTDRNLEVNSFDATYLKLREANISFSLPREFSSKLSISNLSVGLFGNNLFLWTKVPHIDPDNVYQEGGKFRTGMEVLQLPSSRTYGIRLNVTL